MNDSTVEVNERASLYHILKSNNLTTGFLFVSSKLSPPVSPSPTTLYPQIYDRKILLQLGRVLGTCSSGSLIRLYLHLKGEQHTKRVDITLYHVHLWVLNSFIIFTYKNMINVTQRTMRCRHYVVARAPLRP